MPLNPFLPWLLTAIVASVSGMVSGAVRTNAWLAGASALLFATALVATAFDVNRPWWRRTQPAAPPQIQADVGLRNAELITVAYMWGALAMLAVYRLSGIRWRHGWQYGAGMALIMALLLLATWAMAQPQSALRRPSALAAGAWLAWLHTCACLGALTFLVLSGKLASPKGDWPANLIFLFGGIALTVLSGIAAATQQRLAHRARRKHAIESAADAPNKADAAAAE